MQFQLLRAYGLTAVFCWLMTSALLAQPTFFTDGQDADMMISGYGFNQSGGDTVLLHPAGVASDGTVLLVADRWNNRILIWNQVPTSQVPPDVVLGQPNMETNDPGDGMDGLNWPGELAVTQDGKVLVADTYNDRVLIWNTIPTQNGQPADIELAQQEVRWPWGLWTDGQKLAVTSTQGASVLVWNNFPTANNQPSDLSLTANGQFGTPRTITSNGNFLMIGDHNAQGTPNFQGNFVWTTFPTSDTPHDFFMSDPTDPNFAWMQGDFTGDGKLVALGRKLMIWNTPPATDTDLPDLELNFNFDGGDGADVLVVGNQVFVCSMNDSRVFVFNSIPTNAAQQPDFVLGSPGVNIDPLVEHNIITNPVPATNGTGLYVSSDFDRTLYIWNTLPTSHSTPPDHKISLQEAPWDNAMHGDSLILAGRSTVYLWTSPPSNGQQADVSLTGNIGNSSLQDIRGVAYDGQYFYLADKNAGTVYIWSGFPGQSDNPVYTIQEPGIERLHSDGEYLVGTRVDPPGIFIYEVANLSNNPTPFKKIENSMGSATMNLPMYAMVEKDHCFLANTINHVVYVWEDVNDAGDFGKAVVLGSDTGLIEPKPRIGQNHFFWPGSLAFDGEHLWTGEFKFSGRLVRHTIAPEMPSGVAELDGVADGSGLQVQVFPNPSSGAVVLSWQQTQEGSVEVQLMDVAGRIVDRWVRVGSGLKGRMVLGLEGMPRGVYFVEVRGADLAEVVKVVRY